MVAAVGPLRAFITDLCIYSLASSRAAPCVLQAGVAAPHLSPASSGFAVVVHLEYLKNALV